MRSKMTALIAVMLVCVAAFTAGTLALRDGSGHRRWFARPIAARRAVAWVGGLVLLLGAERVLTEDLAPNLYALKQRSLPVKTGVAASNVTYISWSDAPCLQDGLPPQKW